MKVLHHLVTEPWAVTQWNDLAAGTVDNLPAVQGLAVFKEWATKALGRALDCLIHPPAMKYAKRPKREAKAYARFGIIQHDIKRGQQTSRYYTLCLYIHDLRTSVEMKDLQDINEKVYDCMQLQNPAYDLAFNTTKKYKMSDMGFCNEFVPTVVPNTEGEEVTTSVRLLNTRQSSYDFSIPVDIMVDTCISEVDDEVTKSRRFFLKTDKANIFESIDLMAGHLSMLVGGQYMLNIKLDIAPEAIDELKYNYVDLFALRHPFQVTLLVQDKITKDIRKGSFSYDPETTVAKELFSYKKDPLIELTGDKGKSLKYLSPEFHMYLMQLVFNHLDAWGNNKEEAILNSVDVELAYNWQYSPMVLSTTIHGTVDTNFIYHP